MKILETVQYRTPLALAFHDLLTDAPITDGLLVSGRRAGLAGRFRAGNPTPSGVHVLSGLPFLRDAEFPHPGPGRREDTEDLPSAETLDVDVLVEDRLGRFLPTVLVIPSRCGPGRSAFARRSAHVLPRTWGSSSATPHGRSSPGWPVAPC